MSNTPHIFDDDYELLEVKNTLACVYPLSAEQQKELIGRIDMFLDDCTEIAPGSFQVVEDQVKQFAVVEEATVFQFQVAVNQKLKEGWQLHGQVTTAKNDGICYYLVGMTR